MTKLTVYDRNIGTPELVVTRREAINIGTEAPQALDRLGRQLEQMGTEIARKVKAAEQTVEYAGIVAQTKREMATFYSGRSRMADEYGTLVSDTDEYFNDLKARALEGVDGVEQQLRVSQGLDQIGVGYHGQAITDSTTQAIQSVKADQVRARAMMIQDAASGNDDHMSSVMVNYAGMQRSLAEAGIIDMDDAEADILSFGNDAVRGRIRYMMNTDPYLAQEYLTDQNTFSKLLKPEHRENLLAQTDRLINQLEAKAERDKKALEQKREKAEKVLQEQTYVDSTIDIREGRMSQQRLDALAQASMIKGTDYTELSKMYMNRNTEIIGVPEIYNGMRNRAYMGDLNMRDVIVAANDEQLNWSQVDDLVDMVNKGAAFTRTADYKNYLDALRTALGYSPSMAGFSSPAQQDLVSQAQLEYFDRASTGEQPIQIYRDMLPRYIRDRNMIVPKPRYSSVQEAKQNIPPGPSLDIELRAQQEQLRYQAEERAHNQQRQQGNE